MIISKAKQRSLNSQDWSWNIEPITMEIKHYNLLEFDEDYADLVSETFDPKFSSSSYK